MSLFSRLFKNDKSQNINQETDRDSKNVEVSPVNTENEEIVAAIMGAVMAMMQSDVRTDIRIKAIRRIGRTSPVWNIAGRDEYLAVKL